MSKKRIKKKVNFSDETLNFTCEIEKFKEEEGEPGKFTGILVNMQNDSLAKGVYRFKKGSMQGNNGKTLLLLYNHYGELLPVGKLVGEETEKGFEVMGEFHLSKDDNGNYINPEAVKLYSLMKEMKLPFEMSVGGNIVDYKEYSENGKYYIDINKFEAHEGSLTPKGAVQGSKVTRVFNKENGGIGQMDKEQLKLLMAELLANFKTELLEAGTPEEIKNLPVKFNEINLKFEEIKTELNGEFKAEIEKQMNEFNEVIKSLKADFKPTKKEVTVAEQFSAMIQEVEKNGKAVETVFNSESEIKFTADPATTSNSEHTIKTQYVNTLLERLVAQNSALGDIKFIPIVDGSLTIPREVAGLPEVGWIGEEGNREETSAPKTDHVVITLHSLYAMPKVTNKLLATNFVGYANFLVKRVEYALSLKLADALFYGTGTNMPTGILQDSSVTQEVEIDSTDDTTFVDSLIDAYYALDEDVARNAKWYMTSETWAAIAKLKNKQKDFYITDLNNGNTRTLMTRPVILITSKNAGLKSIATATANEMIGVFADLSTAVLGIQNNAMTMRLEDKVTSKGYTKYYMEKGVGLGVQLPENILKLKKKA